MAGRSILVLVAAALASAGCGAEGSASSATTVAGCVAGEAVVGRPLVVVTTVAPITSIVASVVGSTGTEVVGIVPEGIDSHTYEPSPRVAATIAGADVVLINGLDLEQPTRELALANMSDGAVMCELGTALLPESMYVYDSSFPESEGRPNPHLWTNPAMALGYAELVRDVMAQRDPVNADVYAANLAAFATNVGLLDGAVRRATDSIPPDRRLLLTYHDAYAYFAGEYGWTLVGAIQPSSFDEPTPREVADLIDQIEARQVPVVFGSEVFPSPVLAQIAAESGARYVDDLRDDDLPGEPGSNEHSWLALMRFNFVTMVEALGGDASELRALDVSDVVVDTARYP